MRRGARLLASNLRSGRGEIDLLIREAGSIVAVEVKTRVGADPLIQITAAKERRMRQGAARLRPKPVRIDVVTVRLDSGGALVRRLYGVA